MLAADIMTTKLISIPEAASVQEAITLCKSSPLHDFPIINEAGVLIGEVSPHSILRIAAPSYANDQLFAVMKSGPDVHAIYDRLQTMANHPITEVINPNIYTIKSSVPVSAVVAMLTHISDTQHLYVVDENNKLEGMISARDILCRLPEIKET